MKYARRAVMKLGAALLASACSYPVTTGESPSAPKMNRTRNSAGTASGGSTPY